MRTLTLVIRSVIKKNYYSIICNKRTTWNVLTTIQDIGELEYTCNIGYGSWHVNYNLRVSSCVCLCRVT